MQAEEQVLDYAEKLRNSVSIHEKWRTTETLNLIASENFASPAARSFLSSDLSNRYTARDGFYKGTKYIDEVEDLAVKLAKKLYRSKHADVRPLSGHVCSMILFMSLLKSGDKIVTCPPKYGGYPGSSELGLGPLLRLKNLYFPYDQDAMNILPDKTSDLLRREKPEMTVFGSSFIPFPYEIRRSFPKGYKGVKVYDGSHVMGLIAGGEFQQPLSEGCSVLMGSTHKSFFGPQGGIILSNDDAVFSVLDAKVYPGIVDNIHWNRIASLTYALIELLRFGRDYARQVVKNSKALASALHDLGIPVKCKEQGFTESHQVLLGYDEREARLVADKLQTCHMITDVGIRLGTSEATRRGMKEEQMEEIASLISDVVIRRETRTKVKEKVHKLVRQFSTVEYTL